MGHMDQARKHVPLTKPITPTEGTAQEPDNLPTHNVFATITETGKIYTNQTGRFPVQSSTDNQYIMILYDYYCNNILAEALNTRQGPEIVRAYFKMNQHLMSQVFQPKIHWIDNEASNTMEAFNTNNTIKYQLVPPHMHW